MVGNFMRFSAVKRVDIFFRRLDEQVGLAESVLRNRTLSWYNVALTAKKTYGMFLCNSPESPYVCIHDIDGSSIFEVYYHGSREPDDMIAWLHDECTTKFDDRPPPVQESFLGISSR